MGMFGRPATATTVVSAPGVNKTVTTVQRPGGGIFGRPATTTTHVSAPGMNKTVTNVRGPGGVNKTITNVQTGGVNKTITTVNTRP